MAATRQVQPLATIDRRSFVHDIIKLAGTVSSTTALLLIHDHAERTLLSPPPQVDSSDPNDPFVPPSQNQLGRTQRSWASQWRRENGRGERGGEGEKEAAATAACRAAAHLEQVAEELVDLDRLLLDEWRAGGGGWPGTSLPLSSSSSPPESVEAVSIHLATRLSEDATALVLATAAGDLNNPGDGSGGARSGGKAGSKAAAVALREGVGWPWGLCGNRHNCGPLADAQKALTTLGAQRGMLDLGEARFLVDVARRGVDEARGALFLHGPPLWPSGKPFDAPSGAPNAAASEAAAAAGARKEGPPPYLSTVELNRVLGGNDGAKASPGIDTGADGNGGGGGFEDSVMEAYEAEVLAGFMLSRREAKVGRGLVPSTEGNDDKGDDDRRGTSETSPHITKAQRDLSLRLRLGS